jgi:Fungal protein kinase
MSRGCNYWYAHVLPSLHDAFGHSMHKLNYTQRNISTGNILFVNGATKLADLEFAKEISILTTHEVKTVRRSILSTAYLDVLKRGSNEFMALEVQSQRYVYWNKGMASSVVNLLAKPSKRLHITFKYNCLHDLESI